MVESFLCVCQEGSFIYDEYRIPPLNLPRKITLRAIFEAKYPRRLMRTILLLERAIYEYKMREKKEEGRKKIREI